MTSREAERTVLDGITLAANPGSVTGIISDERASVRNLVDILTGTARSESGTVTLNGKTLSRRDIARTVASARRDTEFAPGMTVAENIFVGCAGRFSSYGVMKKHDLYRDAAAMLSRLKSSIDIHAAMESLDEAERQIVVIARVLFSTAPVRIFEYCTDYLTAVQFSAFNDILKHLRADQAHIIFISNNADQQRAFADTVYLLKRGTALVLSPDETATQESVNELTLTSEYSQMLALKNSFARHVEDGMAERDFIRRFVRVIRVLFMTDAFLFTEISGTQRTSFNLRSSTVEPEHIERLRKAGAALAARTTGEHHLENDIDGYIFDTPWHVQYTICAHSAVLASIVHDAKFETLVAAFIETHQRITSRHKELAEHKDIELAGYIQQSLLKSNFDGFGCDIYAISKPAKKIGGDFYDIISIDADRVLVFIADVSGKGVAAGMVMMLLKSILVSMSLESRTPADILGHVNLIMQKELGGEKYATALCYIYNHNAHSLVFANAGHPGLIIAHADGKTELLTDGELPVGIAEKAVYENYTAALAPADAVVAYTDGATEALNSQREEFGDDRLIAACRTPGDAKTLTKGIEEAITAFTEGQDQHDDVTMVTLKV